MSDGFKDFNSFQRVLRNRNIDGHLSVILTELYVQHLDLAKQMDMCANIITGLVETVQNFTKLHEATQGRVQDLLNEMRGGVEVHSEAMTDDGDYHG